MHPAPSHALIVHHRVSEDDREIREPGARPRQSARSKVVERAPCGLVPGMARELGAPEKRHAVPRILFRSSRDAGGTTHRGNCREPVGEKVVVPIGIAALVTDVRNTLRAMRVLRSA